MRVIAIFDIYNFIYNKLYILYISHKTFMTSQPGKILIAMHILLNNSRSKGKPANKIWLVSRI